MNDPDFIPAYQRGTATGRSIIGRKLLTVTARRATSDDSLISNLLKTTFPGLTPYAGEPLQPFAQRVADAAGIPVANWEITGNDGEDPEVPGDEDFIY